MTQAEYELFNGLCSLYHVLLQVVLFLVIWEVFFRPEKGKKEWIFAGAFLAVNVFLRLCPGVPGWVRYVGSAAAVLGYCRIRYKGCMAKAVFTLLLFYNFHGMSFLVSNSFYQFLMDDMPVGPDVGEAESIFLMHKNLMIGQSFNFLLYTLSFVLAVCILKKIIQSPVSMNRQDAVFLSVLNVVGGMLAWMVIDISMVQIDKEIFFLFTRRREMLWKVPMIAVLLCTGELSAIYIFRKYKELQGEREKHFVEEQQMKAMKRRLEEAENFYGAIRRIRHEMKGHMTNIKGLVAGGKYEEVEQYIGKLDETMEELDYKFCTGNAVTDVVINDKYRKAVKSGIAFRVKFAFRKSDTISAFDMGIILNNLLDNAIEACEKLEWARRRISLTLKRKNHFLLVEVENSFDGKLEWEDGKAVPETMKCNSLPEILMEHGVGLKNVKDVAERYLGYMDIKAKGDVFKATVLLQQEEINVVTENSGQVR